ncbi:MAG: c-type cytochrome [Gammaproteobacteria bacterium]|nr:MAG: c-type cytochrome [Gammaproteobacteria bacterium]
MDIKKSNLSVIALTAFIFFLPFGAVAENAKKASDTADNEYSPVIGLEIFRICARCHTSEGWGSKDGIHPQIAGQHKEVLIKQIIDIREGQRENPSMFPFSLHESIGGEQELNDVANYVSMLPMTPDNGQGPWAEGTPEYEEGEKLYKDNCVKCHGETGEGNVALLSPRIQGQHYQYMARQFDWIRDGKRTNANHEMMGQVKSFSDDDMQKVINYVSRLPVPGNLLAPSADWENPDFKIKNN